MQMKSMSINESKYLSGNNLPQIALISGTLFPDSYIRKTCPCNIYPLKPHFYIVKLGFAGVYLFFLFFLQNIDCGYSLEPPRRVPTIYVLSKNKKNIKIFLMTFSIFTGETISVYCMGKFS